MKALGWLQPCARPHTHTRSPVVLLKLLIGSFSLCFYTNFFRFKLIGGWGQGRQNTPEKVLLLCNTHHQVFQLLMYRSLLMI